MSVHWHDVPETAKVAGDILSFSTLLATIVNLLPTAASFLTVIWLLLRIYEMDTVQRWLGRPNDKDAKQ